MPPGRGGEAGRAGWLPAGLAASAVFVLHALHDWTRTTDDAFTTLRAAVHVAEGLGPLVNPGERVEGITNLGWALLLAPFAGGDLVLASKLLSLAFAVGAVLLVAAWGGRRLGPWGTAAALAVLVATPWTPYWAAQGMETTAAAFLVTLAWVRMPVERERGGWPLAGLAMGLAPWLRPETALVPLVLGAWHLARGRAPVRGAALRTAAVVVALGALLVALKLHWFGQVLPNTFHAKVDAGARSRGLLYLRRFLTFPTPALGLLLGTGLLAGAVHAFRRDDRALPALVGAALVAGVTFVDNGDFMANFRLFVPAMPALAAAVGAVFSALALGPASALALAAGVAVALAPAARLQRADRLDQPERPTPEWKRASLLAPWRSPRFGAAFDGQDDWTAAWALVHAGDDEGVACTEIGMVGYATDLRIVDLLGLTDPAMIARGRSAAELWDHLAATSRYVALNIRTVQWDRYREALAAERWKAVGGCNYVWVFSPPDLAPARQPDDVLRARLERLWRRAPRIRSLQLAVVQELVAADAPREIVAWAVERVHDLDAGERRRLRCAAGLEPGCVADVVHCALGGRRVDPTAVDGPEDWPPPVAPRTGRPRTGAGAEAPRPGGPMPSRGAAACDAATGRARDAWKLAAEAWTAAGGSRRGREWMMRASARATALPEEAREAALDAVRAVEAERGALTPEARRARRASDRAWRLCRRVDPAEAAGP